MKSFVLSKKNDLTNGIIKWYSLKRFVLLIVLVSIGCWSHSQKELSFEQIIVDGNISQSIVYCIEQDSFGNIWAGTEEGVIRYNSIDMYLYDNYQGLPKNIANRIMTMFMDSKHKFWIGTEEGVSYYVPEKDRFVFLETGQNMAMSLVACMIEDKGGDLMVGAFNGLWHVSRDSLHVSRLMPGKQVFSILPINDRILVGTQEGLYLYNHNTGESEELFVNQLGGDQMVTTIKKISDRIYIGTRSGGVFRIDTGLSFIEPITIKGVDLSIAWIRDILSVNEREIAIATDGIGLIFMDPRNNLIHWARDNVNYEKSISSNGVYDLLLGEEDLLWIATYGGGINKLSLKQPDFRSITHITNDAGSIAHNLTRVIREDREGKLWFGTKIGLSIYDPGAGSWNNIPSLGKKSGNPDIVLDIVEDGKAMWLATYGNGLFRMNKSDFTTTHFHSQGTGKRKIDLNSIYALYKDSRGNLWAGGIGGDMIQMLPNGDIQTFSISNVRDILELQDGRMVVAGRNGLQLIDGNELSEIETLRTGQSGLDYTSINCVVQKENGELVIGTNGDGLIFHRLGTSDLKIRNRTHDMPSDIIQSIIVENDSSMWLGTTRGLVHLNTFDSDTLITVYEKEDGLVSNEFNYRSALERSNGEFLFGGVDGVVVFDPSRISMVTRTPRIVLEDFKLLKQKDSIEFTLENDINFQDNIILSFSQNSFNIQFAGIMNTTSSKVHYSWKMDGLKEDWSAPTEERQINFVNLSPGEYVLRIRASNRDGLWSEARQLPIEVLNPWWQTNWAYFLYTIFGLLAFSGLTYTITLYLNKRNADEQVQFFNSITHELKTPLSILLSTLESLPKKDKDPNLKKIKSTSSQLINLFEQLLNFHLSNASNINNDNVSKIEVYGHVEKVIRSFKPLMEEKEILVEIKNQWPSGLFHYDTYSLNKILYNLISNAVKYSRQKGRIRVTLGAQKGDLVISVEDNGIGIPRDQQRNILRKYYRGRNAINSQLPGSGLGLMIVKNMIEKEKGSIAFRSEENQGSVFTVRLKDKKHLFNPNMEKEKEDINKLMVDQEEIAEFSDAKILIVEDNDELRDILVEKIGFYFQVYEASNGAIGLEMAEKIFPDLIITDLIMPEMDGMLMCKQLQDNINLNHIPIIMMTVLSGHQQKQESVELGVVSFIEKPVDFAYLMAKMINTLSWSKKMRERYLHQLDVENAEKFRNKKDADFIENLERFVLQEIKQETLSVHDLCKHVGMSRTALYMKLKSMVDLSPQNFIIHTRLKFARKKLLEGEVNVKEVAYMCGFSSPKYFSTSFKKLFGESPSSFLKKLQV